MILTKKMSKILFSVLVLSMIFQSSLLAKNNKLTICEAKLILARDKSNTQINQMLQVINKMILELTNLKNIEVEKILEKYTKISKHDGKSSK